MPAQLVTVFGGTGFLGRRIVRHLHDADFAVRIAARRPERGRLVFSGEVSDIESVRADANDDASVATAVTGAWAVVNAVSLYVEHGNCTFQSVHVKAAKRVALLRARRWDLQFESTSLQQRVGRTIGPLWEAIFWLTCHRRQGSSLFRRP